jgi:transposase
VEYLRPLRACIHKTSRRRYRVGEPEVILLQEEAMKKLDPVGIDVSAKTLVVAADRGREPHVKEFPNNAAGHRRLCRFLTKGSRRARVCVEATGIYSLDLAMALHRTNGIDVMVANPRATRDFARANFQRSKTDGTDATMILEFVKRMPFQSWQPPAQEILDLRAISRRISALTIAITQERCRLHAAKRQNELTSAVADDIAIHLDHLTESIERLSDRALEIIRRSSNLRWRYDLLVSVRGIANASAIRILAELAVLPPDMSPRQWLAHAGLDPRHYESGSSVHKPSRISKTGNKHLRSALYMPALVPIRNEPNIAAFYNKLIRSGKKPMQANVAVMRKLLHSIYGMFNHKQDFRGHKFYALTS